MLNKAEEVFDSFLLMMREGMSLMKFANQGRNRELNSKIMLQKLQKHILKFALFSKVDLSWPIL